MRKFNKKKLPLYGRGQNTREWIYVQDHCEALYKVMMQGKIGSTYNIGSGKNLNNIQISKNIIKTKIGKKNFFMSN